MYFVRHKPKVGQHVINSDVKNLNPIGYALGIATLQYKKAGSKQVIEFKVEQRNATSKYGAYWEITRIINRG